ncbi:MAG TPA: hypothetical protein VH475_12495 [Tepidisphaeraceae bacterium]|jgi:hypothetical protein
MERQVFRRSIEASRIEMVDDAVAEILKRKTPAERIALGFAANRTVRLVIEGSVRSQHPDWDDAAIRAAVARRMLHGTT